MPARLPSAVEWSQHLVTRHIGRGDWCVDATAGNGFDTEFLAKLVGAEGQVWAFDVQASAIAATRERLIAADCAGQCCLLQVSHEHLSRELPSQAHGRVKAMMMNLGYLPSSDKGTITKPESTLSAITQGLDYLAQEGLLTVVTYPGHIGGGDEAAIVANHLSALNPSHWEVQRLTAINRRKPAPECWAVLKLKTQRPHQMNGEAAEGNRREEAT